MQFKGLTRSLLLGAAVSLLIVSAFAQQNGQTGSNAGGNTTNNSANNAGNTAGSTSTSTGTDRSGSKPNSSGGLDPDARYRRQTPVAVTGRVVMDDGSAPPQGTSVLRVCGGRSTKVADVAPNGSFWFEVGGINRNVFADASDPGPGFQSGTMMTNSRGFPDFDSGSMTGFVGCELRAELGGYRSNILLLTSRLTMGPVDIGTIVLYPVQRIGGTMVSVTDLGAPKEAKKALARAENAAKKKKMAEAEQNLAVALEIYPKYAEAWFRLGQLYEQEHRADDARNAFSKALDTDAKYVRPYIELARLAALDQKWAEAANFSDQAMNLDPIDFPEGFYLNAVANYNLKNWDVAETGLRRAQTLDSLHQLPQTHLLMAGLLARKRDHSGEAEQLRSYLKYAPQAENASQVRARLQDLEKSPNPTIK